MRAQRRTDIERKVKWRDIVDPVYATGYQQEMLNARSIIIKEMNSLVIVRLLLTGPCLHNFIVVVLISTDVVHQVFASV